MIRRGFSLLEMVVLLAAIGVVMAISVKMLIALKTAERTAAATDERIRRTALVADKFRTDVRASISAPPVWNQFDAGSRCLILQLASGKHVAYDFRDGVLTRHGDEGPQVIPLPTAWQPEFSVSEDSVSLRLTVPAEKTGRPPFVIVAARGGRP